MISVYTGPPGSGKSSNVMKDIYRYLKMGKNVIVNFPLNMNSKLLKKCKGNYVYLENQDLTVNFLVGYSCQHHVPEKEKQTLLVIDECQNIFNSRTWNAPDRAMWNVFFTQHRKFGYTVILVCPFIEMIDKQLRSCIQNETNFRNLKMFGLFGMLLSCIVGGNFFVAVEKSCQINKRGFVTFSRGRKRIFEMYDSYKIFDERLISIVNEFAIEKESAVEE